MGSLVDIDRMSCITEMSQQISSPTKGKSETQIKHPVEDKFSKSKYSSTLNRFLETT